MRNDAARRRPYPSLSVAPRQPTSWDFLMGLKSHCMRIEESLNSSTLLPLSFPEGRLDQFAPFQVCAALATTDAQLPMTEEQPQPHMSVSTPAGKSSSAVTEGDPPVSTTTTPLPRLLCQTKANLLEHPPSLSPALEIQGATPWNLWLPVLGDWLHRRSPAPQPSLGAPLAINLVNPHHDVRGRSQLSARLRPSVR